MEQSDSKFVMENLENKSRECSNVTWLISVQSFAQNGDFEELEKALSFESFSKSTLNSSLIAAIRQARISTDHLMCVKLLFSKGADLSLVQEGI